jgi:hypothetical protein
MRIKNGIVPPRNWGKRVSFGFEMLSLGRSIAMMATAICTVDLRDVECLSAVMVTFHRNVLCQGECKDVKEVGG